jgi:2-hydroxychromene-2-carboxylate isomerase
MERVFSGVWVEDADLSDLDTIVGKLADSGFDADAILEAAEGPAVAGIYDGNTREAIAADAVGVPAYVLNGEVYWGQDRVEYLERALASGRPPFRAQ